MISVVFFKYFSGFSSLFEVTQVNFRLAINVGHGNASKTPSVSNILSASRYSKQPSLGHTIFRLAAKKTSEYQCVADILQMETRPTEQILRASALRQQFALPIKTGETLQASIIKVGRNSVELQIGRGKVLAQVSKHTANLLAALNQPIPRAVSLRVMQSAPEIVLKIVSAKGQTDRSSLAVHGRELLPKQQPLQTVLTKLSQLNLDSNAQPVPTDAAKGGLQSLGQLWRELPTPRQLTHADGLKAALKNSGLFYEHGLATLMSAIAKPSLDRDLKFQLLAMQQILKQQLTKPGKQTDRHFQSTSGLSQALKLVEAGLARIEILQIANQLPIESGKTITLIELPLNYNGGIEMLEGRIEHSNQHHCSQSEDMPISFQLTIPISDTESILARLIKHRAGISITLWSENPRVRALLEKTYQSFATHLETRQDCQLNVAIGPVEITADDENKVFSNLISEKI